MPNTFADGAHDRFRECIELCEKHGFGRIEVANRPMMAFTQWFAGDTRGALAVADTAIDRAVRVGHRRAEMVGHHAAFFCRHALMEFNTALRNAESALTLAQQLGARRFETEALVFLAELHRLAGRREEALANAKEGVKISGETSPAFLGPVALGALALASDDPTARQAALDQGEELLRAGAVSHNHLLFPRDAIEVYLEAGNWERAERCAAELEQYTRSEPLPFADFYIARGRALAAVNLTSRSSPRNSSGFAPRVSGSVSGSHYVLSRQRSTECANNSSPRRRGGASCQDPCETRLRYTIALKIGH